MHVNQALGLRARPSGLCSSGDCDRNIQQDISSVLQADNLPIQDRDPIQLHELRVRCHSYTRRDLRLQRKSGGENVVISR